MKGLVWLVGSTVEAAYRLRSGGGVALKQAAHDVIVSLCHMFRGSSFQELARCQQELVQGQGLLVIIGCGFQCRCYFPAAAQDGSEAWWWDQEGKGKEEVRLTSYSLAEGWYEVGQCEFHHAVHPSLILSVPDWAVMQKAVHHAKVQRSSGTGMFPHRRCCG